MGNILLTGFDERERVFAMGMESPETARQG